VSSPSGVWGKTRPQMQLHILGHRTLLVAVTVA